MNEELTERLVRLEEKIFFLERSLSKIEDFLFFGKADTEAAVSLTSSLKDAATSSNAPVYTGPTFQERTKGLYELIP